MINFKDYEDKQVLVENIMDTSFKFVESGTGYDLHYLVNLKQGDNNHKVEWYCWHLSKEFFDALEKHGLPPTHLDYDQLMVMVAECKNPE